jgi:hypothetical protein
METSRPSAKATRSISAVMDTLTTSGSIFTAKVPMPFLLEQGLLLPDDTPDAEKEKSVSPVP